MPHYYRPKEDFQVLKVSDVKPLLDNCRDDLRVVVALAFLSGARIGEILQLRKKDVLIDKEHNDIRFLMSIEKLREVFIRELPFEITSDPFVQDIILPYIESMPNQEDLLFTTSQRRYQELLLESNRKTFGEETNKYITFHYLRHSDITYITRDLRSSEWEVKSHTGHKSSAYQEYMIHGSTDRFKGKMYR